MSAKHNSSSLNTLFRSHINNKVLVHRLLMGTTYIKFNQMKSHAFVLYLVDSIQLRLNLRECLSASSAERVCRGGKREGPTLFNYINNSPAVLRAVRIFLKAPGAPKN